VLIDEVGAPIDMFIGDAISKLYSGARFSLADETKNYKPLTLKIKNVKNCLLLLLAISLLCNTAFAQPFNLKKEIKPTELSLIKFTPKDVKKKGRINITKVVQVKDTAYYFVKKLSIYSPIVVSVGVQDPANPVQVSLHKWNWKEVSRPGKPTNEKGYWEETFSTEGDFGIMVVAPQKPSAYNIYVWVGDEVKMKIAAPFKSYSPSSGGGLFTLKNILIGIALLLIIVISWFFIKKKKKMKNLTILLIAILLTPLSSMAQLDNIFDDPETQEILRNDNAGSVPLDGNDFVVQNPRTRGERAAQEFENASNAAEHLDNVVGAINNVVDIIDTGRELWDAAGVLDAGECTPDFTQPENALVPSSCSGTAGCNDCYSTALASFNADRQTLARMMCLFMNTKNFTDKAIAFGNAMASLPGGVGLGWIPAKRNIDQAYTKFKATYDKKARELLTSLQKNMMKIDACENSFGLKDWYQRFGFMYFEFMQQKYKRPD